MTENIDNNTNITDNLITEQGQRYTVFEDTSDIQYSILEDNTTVIMDSVGGSNTRQSVSYTEEDVSGHVQVTLHDKYPISVVAGIIIWCIGTLFGLGSIYSNQQAFNEKIADELSDIKATIYTKQEAALQFAALKDENDRQDEVIRDLKDQINRLVYNGK
jgi:hypothetical protein